MENLEITYIENLPVERWEEFKNLKIEAITNDPSAFSHTLNEAINSQDEEWKSSLEKVMKGEGIMVFAEHKGKLIGMGKTHFFTKERFKHNASLQSLYVSPKYRGRGIAKEIEIRQLKLISEKPEIALVFGEIFSSQIASLELHKKLGFEVVGTIRDFMQYEGKYYDSVFVQKRIRNL